MAKRSTVQINYRSGHTMKVTCDSFTVTHAGGDILQIEWKNVSPNPLHMGVSQIESVWEL